MPHVVFGRMVEPGEVPEYNRKEMNARRIGQACFVVYLGLDASAEELGLRGYDTFLRKDSNNRNQYRTCGAIETHTDFSALC